MILGGARVVPTDCQLQARFLFRPSLMFNTWYPHPPTPHPLRIIFVIMGLGTLPAKIFIANDLLSKYSGIRT